ncbi:hypothetical protein [Roseateles sp. LYH14W]|uniref:Uncharacterized protein n=1 Tax=Pelomonas parva TaxID=3299032 RepID=A0ABW7FDQ8_9BURK
MVSTGRESEHQQLDLLGAVATPLTESVASAPHKPGKGNSRDRVCVELRGLGDRLRAQAQRLHTTAAVLTRRAVLLLLDDRPSGDETAITTPADAPARGIVKVTLRVSRAHATSLTSRARAADMSQGDYVSSLLDGVAPVAMPADHASAVKALMASTDRLAALSADLNAFLRVLGRASVPQLEPYRASLTSLTKGVRQHLATAAELVAELRPARRPRR